MTDHQAAIRRSASALITGGALTAATGAFVQFVMVPRSTVSPEMWSYPWSAAAHVPVSAAYGVFHVLVAIGLVGLLRSRMAGTSAPARWGVGLAIAGTVILTAAEAATVFVRDARLDDGPAMAVGTIFGLGTAISALGLVIGGITALRAGRWQSWRRWTVLISGLWTTALIGLVMTDVMALAIGVYGASLLLIGVALYAQPTPAAVRSPSEAARRWQST